MFRSRVVWAILVLIVLVVVSAFVIPPSQSITRAVALASSEWLLTGPLDTDDRATRIGKRVIGAYVQMAVGAAIANRVEKRASSEEEILHQIMLVVRDKTLNQKQFDHIPRRWPALIAGAGYCDQINGAVAMIAARHFEKSQLYGLYEAETRNSPHTIGRVWSKTRNDWIYFDAFYEVPVMFTRGADRQPQYLTVAAPAVPMPSRTKVPEGYYALPGWIMTDMHATFAGFLMARASGEALAPATPAPAPEPEKKEEIVETSRPALSNPPIPVLPPRQKIEENTFATISESYVRARLDDLFDETATPAYQKIADKTVAQGDDRATEIATMAGLFADNSARRANVGSAD